MSVVYMYRVYVCIVYVHMCAGTCTYAHAEDGELLAVLLHRSLLSSIATGSFTEPIL